MGQALFIFLLTAVSFFMIILILIQRGKGGGLAGAFGGMGGQSAFGTKAGDMFTKITVVTACIWFAICISSLLLLKYNGSFNVGGGRNPITPTSEGYAGEGVDPNKAGTTTTPAAPESPTSPAPTTTTPDAPATSTPAAPAPTK